MKLVAKLIIQEFSEYFQWKEELIYSGMRPPHPHLLEACEKKIHVIHQKISVPLLETGMCLHPHSVLY